MVLTALCCCLLLSHFSRIRSESVRPHRWQPTRLPHSWDSPGKNTGVGCHFLLQCMKVKSESEGAQLCPTLSDPVDCSPPGSSVHGIFQARVLEWDAIAFSNCSIDQPNWLEEIRSWEMGTLATSCLQMLSWVKYICSDPLCLLLFLSVPWHEEGRLPPFELLGEEEGRE